MFEINSKNDSAVIHPFSVKPMLHPAGILLLTLYGTRWYQCTTIGGTTIEPAAFTINNEVKHSFSSPLAILYTDLEPFLTITQPGFGQS